MDERLYKRGRIWWGTYYDAAGRRVRQSTHCTDRHAARLVLREWERRAADPAYAAAHEATIGSALQRLILDRQNKGRAEGTLHMYRWKGGHVLRVMGSDTPLARVNARLVDAYVDQRLEEGAAGTASTRS